MTLAELIRKLQELQDQGKEVDIRQQGEDLVISGLSHRRRRLRRRNPTKKKLDFDRLSLFRRRRNIDMDRLSSFRRRRNIDIDRLSSFRHRRRWRRNPAPNGTAWGPDLYNPLEDKDHNFKNDSHYRKYLAKSRRNPLPELDSNRCPSCKLRFNLHSRWCDRRRGA